MAQSNQATYSTQNGVSGIQSGDQWTNAAYAAPGLVAAANSGQSYTPSNAPTTRVNGISQVAGIPNAPQQTPQPGQPIDTSQTSPKPTSITPATGANTQSNPMTPTVSFDQALKGLTSGGAKGTELATATQDLKNKYQTGLSNAQSSGGAVPQGNGDGSAGVQSNLPPPPPQQYDSTQADAVLKDNAAHQQYINDYTQSQSSQAQTETLTQTYSDLMDKLGIPALNTELMNMKNIMDGSEQDIRNEITKSGGFATNSQVLAMTDARNKTMQQNYNNLLQTRDDAQKNLTTMMDFTEKDRAYAQTKIDSQLNFDKQNIDYADKALANAQSAYSTMQKSEGWDGIYKAALATGDPTAVQRINSTMGPGFDLATMAKQDALTRSQTQQKTNLELAQAGANLKNTEMDVKTKQQNLNDSAGLPNPAKANQVGYDAQGVKYNASNASNEILDYWKGQQAFDPKTGKIPPAFYNSALASWVKNGLPATSFAIIFGRYKDPLQDSTKTKLYN